MKVKGVKTLLVISDASFYGDGLAKVVAADAKALGATVMTQTIPNVNTGGGGTTTEYGPAATAIATGDPGAIFYGGYSPDFGLLLSALSVLVTRRSAHVIMSGDGSNSPALITSTSPASAANGVFLSEGAAGKVNFLTGKLATSYFKLTQDQGVSRRVRRSGLRRDQRHHRGAREDEDASHGDDVTPQGDRHEPAQGELQGHHGNDCVRG